MQCRSRSFCYPEKFPPSPNEGTDLAESISGCVQKRVYSIFLWKRDRSGLDMLSIEENLSLSLQEPLVKGWCSTASWIKEVSVAYPATVCLWICNDKRGNVALEAVQTVLCVHLSCATTSLHHFQNIQKLQIPEGTSRLTVKKDVENLCLEVDGLGVTDEKEVAGHVSLQKSMTKHLREHVISLKIFAYFSPHFVTFCVESPELSEEETSKGQDRTLSIFRFLVFSWVTCWRPLAQEGPWGAFNLIKLREIPDVPINKEGSRSCLFLLQDCVYPLERIYLYLSSLETKAACVKTLHSCNPSSKLALVEKMISK